MTYAYCVAQYRLSLMRAALAGTHGNIEAAARALGLTRSAFYAVYKRCGLNLPRELAASRRYEPPR